MIRMNEFQIRLLCLLCLIFANPLIQSIMSHIAKLQSYTSKQFILLGHLIDKSWGFKLNLFTLVSLSQIFWPLFLTLMINMLLKWMKKPELNHPNIYLFFIWLLFNGSFTLMQQGNI